MSIIFPLSNKHTVLLHHGLLNMAHLSCSSGTGWRGARQKTAGSEFRFDNTQDWLFWIRFKQREEEEREFSVEGHRRGNTSTTLVLEGTGAVLKQSDFFPLQSHRLFLVLRHCPDRHHNGGLQFKNWWRRRGKLTHFLPALSRSTPILTNSIVGGTFQGRGGEGWGLPSVLPCQ